jgi:hypothetical protein
MRPSQRDGFRVFALALALVAALGASAAAKPPTNKPTTKRVLFFTKSSGFQHTVVKWDDAKDCHACKAMRDMAAAGGFEVDHTKDGGVFTPGGIAKYDAFVFYTSGDLTKPGTDGEPPMTAAGKELLLESIRKGKGFVSMHAGTDAFHSPGPRTEHECTAGRRIPSPGRACTARGASSTRRSGTARTSGPTPPSRA